MHSAPALTPARAVLLQPVKTCGAVVRATVHMGADTLCRVATAALKLVRPAPAIDLWLAKPGSAFAAEARRAEAREKQIAAADTAWLDKEIRQEVEFMWNPGEQGKAEMRDLCNRAEWLAAWSETPDDPRLGAALNELQAFCAGPVDALPLRGPQFRLFRVLFKIAVGCAVARRSLMTCPPEQRGAALRLLWLQLAKLQLGHVAGAPLDTVHDLMVMAVIYRAQLAYFDAKLAHCAQEPHDALQAARDIAATQLHNCLVIQLSQPR